MTTTPLHSADDLAKLSSAELAQLVRELRSGAGQLPSAAQSLLDDQLRRTSLLTQLAIEFREAIDPEQIVEQTLRTLSAHLVEGASVILVGPGQRIELAMVTSADGGVQP